MFARSLKLGFSILFCHLILGCVTSNGPLHYASHEETNRISYLPIGIPYFIGGHGSAIPITNELSLTAKHIAMIDYSNVIAYHPHCDIAIIKKNNEYKIKSTLGLIRENEKTMTLGWGLLHRVVKGEGKYYFDVNIVNQNAYKKCLASLTNAPVQSGMSGGGVFNEKHELVGVITGMAGSDFRLLDDRKIDSKIISIFVSTNYLKKWIFDTLEEHYQKPIKRIELKMNL